MTATRRRRRPLAMNSVSDSDSYTDDGTQDEEYVEPVIVAPGPSDHVRDIVRRAQATRASTPDELEGSQEEDLSPGTRLETVKIRAPEYEREYRLKLIHRLLMRKIPLDEIAVQLEVSVSTIHRNRREIYRRLRDEAARLDINALLGETMAFYGEAGAMAMRIATSGKTATPHRLAALRTAMTSKKELGQWLAGSGVFEQLKYVPQDQAQSGDLAKLIALSEKVLLDEDDTLEDLGDLTADDLMDENISLML